MGNHTPPPRERGITLLVRETLSGINDDERDGGDSSIRELFIPVTVYTAAVVWFTFPSNGFMVVVPHISKTFGLFRGKRWDRGYPSTIRSLMM